MERDAKDRCMNWLALKHPRAMLSASGVTNITSCKSLHGVLTFPKVIPDGMFEAQIAGEEKKRYYVVEVTTYPDKEECDQVLRAVSLIFLAFEVVPDVISLVLAPKGNLTQENRKEVRSTSGDTRLGCTWVVRDLFTRHSSELLALNEVGVIPLVLFTIPDADPKVLLEECRERIETQATPEERGNLLAIAATFATFKYPKTTLYEIFLRRPQEMIEAPVLQELMTRAPEAAANLPFVKNLVALREQATRLEDARRAVLENVKARFDAVPEDIRSGVEAISDTERLWGLVPLSAKESLDKIREKLQ